MAEAEASGRVVVWEEGRLALLDDPVFGPWVQEIGSVEVPASDDLEPFAYLTRAICFQQLAGAAATTIHGRVVQALGGAVHPQAVLDTPEEALRGAGLSRSKLKAIRDLAGRIESGALLMDDLDDQPDDEVVRRLMTVWGIGSWTARMYLMFRLHRPDVWPVGDLGVRQGFARAAALGATPSAAELEPLGDRYRPWRSAVAFYCWRILETELP